MKYPIQLLLCVGLGINLSALQAEHHCPGNIDGITPRFIQRALIVIPVKINRAGPFDFMLDTGTQITVVDPLLASEIGLKSEGTVGLVKTASYSQASVATLDTLEAGSHVVANSYVVVEDLEQIQAADRRIRGVLGENFLAHFDLLIDYPQRLLCLDEARMMQEYVRGERIPLVAPQRPENELPLTERLVIPVRLSGTGSRQVLLQLDSGSDGPILYAANKKTVLPLLKRAKLRGDNSSKSQQSFALLPPQDMRVGSRTFSQVPFVTPVSTAQNLPDREEDGVLPTALFNGVYINFAHHYVVFNPEIVAKPRSIHLAEKSANRTDTSRCQLTINRGDTSGRSQGRRSAPSLSVAESRPCGNHSRQGCKS
ncbi:MULTISPECIES: retropepsin-like aspartic protease [Acidobacteriaceae]|uniref:retropepsin-like aspartic protease n=1 Tax=Acidobacteriaceae TaxID=204434 RepID=UPI00131AFE75|nr:MULTISPECIES: retropepsin-like aspartic protease [Acidobacteriaceae]MDW5267598.1 retropepsin-like aspartic protease [Edaphobacter sp.]